MKMVNIGCLSDLCWPINEKSHLTLIIMWEGKKKTCSLLFVDKKMEAQRSDLTFSRSCSWSKQIQAWDPDLFVAKDNALFLTPVDGQRA